ncbi:potassium channel family protein [Nocardiopsis sp. FIRDI 009]|uniref:potassium channel family protein n=1 Tax=Nocardiopsis sp. FIRDI 009 TaxID=714197 RepID=UPI001E5E6C99|nr:potassium channel family protein [Nocardiopsis sp. FIRDI 009]
MDAPQTRPDKRGPERLQQWQNATEWPLLALAVGFLVAYAWPILDPDLSEQWVEVCAAAAWVVWFAFTADYLVRLYLAPDRWAFVRANLLDLAICLLPMLRPLRLVRLLSVVSILHRKLSVSARGNVVLYTATLTVIILLVASLAVLKAERDAPGANITTIGDASWWTLVTISTVGYGDHYPVTDVGRLIAICLFIVGIALLGVITGVLASWFVKTIEGEQEQERETRERERARDSLSGDEVRELRDLVRELRAELAHSRAERGNGQAAGGGNGQDAEPVAARLTEPADRSD